MNIFRRKGKVDWLTIIPFLFWLSCMGLAVGRLFQTENEIHFIDWLEIINSNTFSTYLSMIICMAYQFFSVSNTKKQEESGLSRKWISMSILSTIIYGIVAIINVCRYNLWTTIIMTFVSLLYVFLFYKFMRAK